MQFTVETYGNMRISYDSILHVFDTEMILNDNTRKIPGRQIDDLESTLWSLLNTKCKSFIQLVFIHAMAQKETKAKSLSIQIVDKIRIAQLNYHDNSSIQLTEAIPIIEIPHAYEIIIDFIKISH